MKQYNSIKAKHPEAILLFRVGDFYETFSEDAIKTSSILGITLTRRANGSASYVELAGFPYHAIETYLPKLIRAGQRVAICEQLEDPKTVGNNIVKRGVTEMITPGITVNENVLQSKENNFLASIYFGKKWSPTIGISFLDISTGEFFATTGNSNYIDKLLNSFLPKEILIEKSAKSNYINLFGDKFYTYYIDDWMFNDETSTDRLLKQFGTNSLKGFGFSQFDSGIIAAGSILQYLDITYQQRTEHITKLQKIAVENYVWLDKFTQRNLEILTPLHDNGIALIDILDKTQTPMGARTLRRWLNFPLLDLKKIIYRQDIINYFFSNPDFINSLNTHLKKIGDLERIATKISLLKCNPRDLLQLRYAFEAIHIINECTSNFNNKNIIELLQKLDPCTNIIDKIKKVIKEDCSTLISKGDVIANEVDTELDELRSLVKNGKDYLTKIEEREAKITGISSLKISYNNVFGYFFEVKNTHKQRVPQNWIRKQTLSNAERYINEELKEYETKILGAEEKISQLEYKIYNALINNILTYIPTIQKNAQIIGQADSLLSLAAVAKSNNYCKPIVTDNDTIEIKNGRHPVIEKQLPTGNEYIGNDITLNTNDQQIIMLTGPNMAGKSAFLRQTALIVLMAQIGSFIPANSANIGYIDRIFTRVGATDNISSGESTFMVEMNEAASIINNLSTRSLILFDELGRGTSTYDGISIAWSIVEYIHEHPQFKPKTLFATHYHELNEMENSFKRIKNYNITVKEAGNKIIFVRKLCKGGSEHSFGIHVAKMAGMPQSVVNRAEIILKELESNRENSELPKRPAGNSISQHREGYQLSFFQLDDPILKQIRDEVIKLDINTLTPIEALNKLNEIKKIISGK